MKFILQTMLALLFTVSLRAASIEGNIQSKFVSITAAGAVGDGVTLNTAAIQQTIDSLATNSGGTVLIPKGEFLSGAIFLKPGVNLHLDKGAVLKGSTNILDYPEMPTRIEGHFQVWIPALI